MAVMAKAPVPGSVKTRLVPPLLPKEAARLSVCFLRDVTEGIATLAPDGRVHGYAAYTPVGEEAAFRGVLPPSFRLVAQRGENLTERLIHAAEDLFATGYASLCFINSDSPTLPHCLLETAVASLRAPGDRLVLGPSEDGGYYLIGMKQFHCRLFEGIAWSTKEVLAQTKDRAAEMNLEMKLLPAWYDVDDSYSLRRLCEELLRPGGHSAGQKLEGYAAPHTSELLRELLRSDARDRLGWDRAV